MTHHLDRKACVPTPAQADQPIHGRSRITRRGESLHVLSSSASRVSHHLNETARRMAGCFVDWLGD